LNAFSLFLQHQISKFPTCFILDIFHAKRFEIDMVGGILYRFEHGGIDSRTINEQGDFVPLRQRAFTHRFYYGVYRSRMSVAPANRFCRSMRAVLCLGDKSPLADAMCAGLWGVATSSITPETFGKVAHPPPRVPREANSKKRENALVLFMVSLIKEEYSPPTHREARGRTRSKQEPVAS